MMKYFKLLMYCLFVAVGIQKAAAQMVGTPYIVNSQPACVAPSGLTVTGSTPSLTKGSAASFTLTGTNVSSAAWSITPTTGVSTATGTSTSTGNITFATSGTYTITFTATSSGATCASVTAVASTTLTVVDAAVITTNSVSGGVNGLYGLTTNHGYAYHGAFGGSGTGTANLDCNNTNYGYIRLNYVGANGGSYPTTNINAGGVQFTINAGTLAIGDGVINANVVGGSASFCGSPACNSSGSFTFLGKSWTFTIAVKGGMTGGPGSGSCPY